MPFSLIVLAALVSTLTLGLLMRLAPRTGLMDFPGDRRRLHREAVPRIGGLAVFTGSLTGLTVSQPLIPVLGYGLAGAALLVIVGALDDRYQLGARLRLMAQLGAGLLLTLGGGVVVTSLGNLLGGGPLLLGAWALPFSLLAIVGVINALNMIDGIDGLAAGVTAIALGSLLFFIPETSPLHGLLIATLAALLPYLLCNLELCPWRCKIFLGDAGSMLLGYLVVWALIEASRVPAGITPVTALWLLAVPLMDIMAVIGRRWRNGRHPFSADRGHLHHLLARLFHSARRALMALLVFASLLAGMGLMGQALALPEALMFYLALACFAGYLAIVSRVPALHRKRLKHQRRVS